MAGYQNKIDYVYFSIAINVGARVPAGSSGRCAEGAAHHCQVYYVHFEVPVEISRGS